MAALRLRAVVFLLLALLDIALSSSSYTPVTALDKYGNSIQLKHAREAASRHGRLIVAARSSREVVVVVSIYTPKLGQLTTSSSSSSSSVLQRLLLGDTSLYLACTGVKADATWLVQTMRRYSIRLWERYDVANLTPTRISQAISQALLGFMGYDRSQEYHDGVTVGVGADTKNDSWARPLGIQTLIVSPHSLILVEPSGIAQPDMEYVAVGKESAAIQRVLQERYRSDASAEEIQELVINIIRETVEGQASAELVVEVVSKDGVEVSSVPLRPQAK
jgi:20S proteasome alpha/beta subunit